MNSLLQDARYGIRMLARSPVVSTVAALSLGLGIAAATAMVAVASGFWLEPLPFGDQEGLILARELRHGDQVDMAANASAANFRDWQAGATTLSGMTAMDIERQNVTGVDMPEEIQVAAVTSGFFQVLQMQPAQGRAFREEEGTEGQARVAVITNQYWERRFEADPEVLGRTLILDGAPHTVVGVMPEGFEMLPAGVQAFRPVDVSQVEDRGSKGWVVFGRLRPGATVAQARAELEGIQARLENEFPEGNRGWGVLVQPAREWFPGPTDAKLILLLIAVSLFGVAIACANVANLLLGRAEARMKEMAVRTALGAGRGRIVRQLLTESLLLGIAGGGMGTLLSVYVIRGLDNAMPAELPRAFRPELDPFTLLVTVGIALGAGILFGLAPALYSAKGDLRESMGEGARGGTAGRKRKRVRGLFVIGQVAVALALLTGAGELGQIMNSLVFSDNGFKEENVLTFQLSLPEYRYQEDAELRQAGEEILRVLQELPGVQSAALLLGLPRGRAVPNSFYSMEGNEYEDPNQRPRANWDAVSPGFFATLEIPVVTGRGFAETDREDSRMVAVVNQEFVRRNVPDGSPLGRRVVLQGQPREIVGVVRNFMQRRIPFDGLMEPAIFIPASQYPARNISFALRTAGNPLALASDVRTAVWSVDPDQPIARLQTLEAYIETELAAPAFLGRFVAALCILTLLLSGMGIYGVMAHSVLQERRAMGIRKALGARGRQLVGMITLRGLMMSGAGMVLGVPPAILIHRAVLNAMGLFQAELGWEIGVLAGFLLGGVALISSVLPARAAAAVEPTRALSMD